MNIYQRLEQDHEAQRALVREVRATAGDSSERRAAWQRLKTELMAHADAEEQTFYAALMAEPEGQDKARHSVTEHEEMNDLIAELDELDMASPGWLQKFDKLQHDVEHHLDEEEKDVFVLARRVLDDSVASELTARFDERKTAERVS